MLSTGQAEPNVYEGKLPHIPLYFTDKQTYSVAIDNVYVGGVTGVPYTDCEVFMPLGLHTNVSESRHFDAHGQLNFSMFQNIFELSIT